MKGGLLWIGALVLTVPFCVPQTAWAKDDQITLRDALEKARDVSDIRAKGMPGFYLSGTLRLWITKDAPSEGKYLLVWTPDGRWREEIAFKDYLRKRVGDGKQFWQTRTPEIENFYIHQLDELLRVKRAPKIRPEDKLTQLDPEKIGTIEARCVLLKPREGPNRTLCLDPGTNELLRDTSGVPSPGISWDLRSEEYSQYQKWAGRTYPRLLRGFHGNQLLVEVQFDEIKPAPELPPDYFAPAKDATLWADCPEGGGWKLKNRVSPVYPASARAKREQGTVILSAVIEQDGRVSHLRVAHSAGFELNSSALEAVSQWRYERVGCPEAAGRAETLIEVLYSLQW